ncbi:unnamed protein product [Polarella glacialis]|uniref:RAP domain-containing protein n=1 Tax=Polarella glacialis TaxID=89957 RepID=A0A813JR03_POLGL|nr:unnamed protein product [Polarella glacialis]
MDYMLQEVRAKARRFLVKDTALLLNGLAKLGLKDELLTRSLLPPLMRRITEKTKWEDLALLALSYARLGDPSRVPVFDCIVAALTPRIQRIGDGHSLSLLACAFTKLQPEVRPAGAEEGGTEAVSSPRKFRRGGEDAPEPLFRAKASHAMPPMLPDMDEDYFATSRAVHHSPSKVEGGYIAHLAFVEVLLEQCDDRIMTFRGSDILHLSLALSTLTVSGNERVIPPRLLPRLCRRLEMLYYELLPAQFVQLLDLCQHLPDLEEKCGTRLLDELTYRARDLTPRSCLPVLRAAVRLGHTRAQSAVAWRLTRPDSAATGPAVLSTFEVCETASLLTSAVLNPSQSPSRRSKDSSSGPWKVQQGKKAGTPSSQVPPTDLILNFGGPPKVRDAPTADFLWEAREAMLILLQGLAQRRLEPEPGRLARLLHSYGLLSVRDTHWFHLCSKLSAYDLSQPPMGTKRGLAPVPALPLHETLDEASLAGATLALARLSFPQLVDAASLFSRCAAVMKSPGPAVAVLEAAAIFVLTDRRPQDLVASKLVPIVEAVWAGQNPDLQSDDELLEETDDEGAGDGRAPRASFAVPRLFPFSGNLAESCTPREVLDSWAAASAATGTSSSSRPRGSRGVASSGFEEAVAQELASWGPEVGLVTSVPVGPLNVPFALSLVGLARHLKRRPLQGYPDPGDMRAATELGRPPGPRASSQRRGRRRGRLLEQASDPVDLHTPDVTIQASDASEPPLTAAGVAEETSLAEDSALGEAVESERPVGRRSHRRRPAPAGSRGTSDPPEGRGEAQPTEASDSDSDGEEPQILVPRPETHVLLELLRDRDFFHASPSLRGEQQRSKGRLLTAERNAELRLLRRRGWNVCCVSEHLWQLGLDGDLDAASEANRTLIFELISNLEGGRG